MPMSQRSTLWAVSGAIGLTSFGLGAFALQGSGPAPIEARPVVVPLSTPAGTPSGHEHAECVALRRPQRDRLPEQHPSDAIGRRVRNRPFRR